MAKTNPINKARKAYEDALEAGIHIDIGSHNTRAKNPAKRKGTSRPKRVSQITKRPPTKRLVARRRANTAPGYFPNPVTPEEFTKFNSEFTRALEAAQTRHKDKLVAQARLSYVQGMLVAGEILGAVTPLERSSFMKQLNEIVKG